MDSFLFPSFLSRDIARVSSRSFWAAKPKEISLLFGSESPAGEIIGQVEKKGGGGFLPNKKGEREGSVLGGVRGRGSREGSLDRKCFLHMGQDIKLTYHKIGQNKLKSSSLFSNYFIWFLFRKANISFKNSFNVATFSNLVSFVTLPEY